jgi:hypothetical protein
MSSDLAAFRNAGTLQCDPKPDNDHIKEPKTIADDAIRHGPRE